MARQDRRAVDTADVAGAAAPDAERMSPGMKACSVVGPRVAAGATSAASVFSRQSAVAPSPECRKMCNGATTQAPNMLAITGQFPLPAAVPAFDTGGLLLAAGGRRPEAGRSEPPIVVQVEITSPVDSNDYSNP